MRAKVFGGIAANLKKAGTNGWVIRDVAQTPAD
jgi:hypothetical protein